LVEVVWDLLLAAQVGDRQRKVGSEQEIRKRERETKKRPQRSGLRCATSRKTVLLIVSEWFADQDRCDVEKGGVVDKGETDLCRVIDDHGGALVLVRVANRDPDALCLLLVAVEVEVEWA